MTAKPHWIMDELMAKIALRDLDAMTEGFECEPVLAEVSKAITVAQTHPDIEARVVCRTLDQAVDAVMALSGFATKEPGATFKPSDLSIELSNGSAVVVRMRP